MRDSNPGLALQYERAARRTLKRGLRFLPVDPRLHSIFGLLEFEAGNPTDARTHLEKAYAASVAGTRAHLALAQLRFDEAISAHPEGDRRLSAEQLEQVLEPLFAARERSPALAETYHWLAKVWGYSALVPAKNHLAVVREGLAFFPRDDELRRAIAAVYEQYGYREEVAELALPVDSPAR
jgi:hypothetical protein